MTNVQQGNHKIQTDYYENTGQAAIFSDIVPFDSWLVYYYPNTNLDGYPVDAKVIAPQGDEKALVENNGEGSPTSKVPTNNFSARYTTVKRLPAGEYIIRGKADDGMRVYIDGKLVIDEWNTGKWDKEHAKKITIQDNTASEAIGKTNEKDTHLIEVQYLEFGGGSNIQFNIQPYSKAIQSNTWIAEYYNNKELKGDAIVLAGKNPQNKIENIDFDWKDGSPSTNIPNDNFSARYTKYDEFSQGDYTFEARADDGVRIYVDNMKVIDSWIGSAGDTRKATVPMTAGTHKVVIEYLELSGNALIQAHYYKNKESETNNNIPNNNLIGNGDFESDIEKQLWEKTLNAGAQLFKDTKEKPPEGSSASSIRVDVSKGENSIASSRLVEYKQRVKVSPNQTYSLSIWSKTKGENISRNIDLTFFKDESNWINDALTMPTYTINSKENWSKSEYVFTTSPTTNFIEVKIRIGRNLLGVSKGSVWFDSANLKAIQPNMVGQTTKFNNWKVDTSTPGTVGKANPIMI
ncbi:PA14 domain-containing protein [Bacillus sp. JJ864]|uniref:PA14 domain-containing protein n=1 Tax=Bacillus sp. JJ864 TaxID=3122975 RepID=UPI002FFEC91A